MARREVNIDQWADYLNEHQTYAREGKLNEDETLEHVCKESGMMLGRVVYSEPKVYEIFTD